MLRSIKDLEDYAIHATDGNIGHVKNFYFDDEAEVICYCVVDARDSSLGKLDSCCAIRTASALRARISAPR